MLLQTVICLQKGTNIESLLYFVFLCLDMTIVHFTHLGSRCHYDLFERCYFFFLNRYAYSKTKPQDIWEFLIFFFIKLVSQ